MKWHRGQQLWLAAASLVPGFLVFKQIIMPVYAALMLIFLYFLSKRHAYLVQCQFEREDHERRDREADEKRRLAALPARKRRSVERAKRWQLEGDEAEGIDDKDE